MLDFVSINDGFYGVDFSRADDTFIRCILFDMNSLWVEQVPITALIEREHKRNPIISCNETIVDSTLFAKPATLYTVEQGNGDESDRLVTLTAKYYVGGMPVTFGFELMVGTACQFSEYMTIPLWRAMLLLETQNHSLKQMLVKKDAELEQYRIEGAVLKRTTLQTPVFNEQLFEKQFADQGAVGKIVGLLARGQRQRTDLMRAVSFVDPANTVAETETTTTTAAQPGVSCSSGNNRSPRTGANKRKSKRWHPSFSKPRNPSMANIPNPSFWWPVDGD
ncbi:non-homologous end-joining factor 1-like [Anopheles bellator]|uniref:non-homologous end-joining factor 1-like n=1 Tax=Anopheles bellator TaxID=139047 RepID=UPI0026478101|nr:non-homologous end-joining factor 1-like [Anopheles bellator]XP_058063894.1 non-homologous end-joining factor 1-like [Anopheles bellator]